MIRLEELIKFAMIRLEELMWRDDLDYAVRLTQSNLSKS